MFDQGFGELRDMHGGLLHQVDRSGVSRSGVVDHDRRDGRVVGGAGPVHPVEISTGSGENFASTSSANAVGGARPSRVRSESHGVEADVGAAAFVGDGEAIAADADGLAA